MPGTYSASITQDYFPINIPDYCNIIGSSSSEVILNAELWGNVITINYNDESDISGITITGGKGGYTAGGITCINSDPSLTNLLIKNNFGWNPILMQQGGGVLLSNSNSLIKNVLIANNNAYRGGGTYISSSNPRLINVTFSGNVNGGIEISGTSDVELTNSIMWGDSATANISEIVFANADTNQASISIERCDIFGGLEGIGISENDTVYWLEGNIVEDPMFVGTGDYQLYDNSPCIDAGTPDTTGLDLPIGDIIGNLRIWDGDNNGTAIVDMGAYEYGSLPVSIQERPLKLKSEISAFNIFPNPSTELINLSFELKKKNEIIISVYNNSGQEIEKFNIGTFGRGKYTISITLEGYTRGIYFITLESENEKLVRKLIIE